GVHGALTKNGDRADSAFPQAVGSVSDKNDQGQGILDGIVTSPDRVDLHNRHDGTDVHESPNGRGARFDQNGNSWVFSNQGDRNEKNRVGYSSFKRV
ncbi:MULTISPECIES: hypothetical protein, partial [Pseudomonas syringae group]